MIGDPLLTGPGSTGVRFRFVPFSGPKYPESPRTGKWRVLDRPERLAHSYTLQAGKSV